MSNGVDWGSVSTIDSICMQCPDTPSGLHPVLRRIRDMDGDASVATKAQYGISRPRDRGRCHGISLCDEGQGDSGCAESARPCVGNGLCLSPPVRHGLQTACGCHPRFGGQSVSSWVLRSSTPALSNPISEPMSRNCMPCPALACAAVAEPQAMPVGLPAR